MGENRKATLIQKISTDKSLFFSLCALRCVRTHPCHSSVSSLIPSLNRTHLPVVAWATVPLEHLIVVVLLLLHLSFLLLAFNQYKLLFDMVCHTVLLLPLSFKYAQVWAIVCQVGTQFISTVGKGEGGENLSVC